MSAITDALRANVAGAKSKAGRKLAEDELARWLARKAPHPYHPSPFSRFVDSLVNTDVLASADEKTTPKESTL